MQVIDFIIELRLELAIITNRTSLIDLNKVKKIVKNIESVSLISKNILAITIILAVIKIKELKAQILKLKIKLKNFKYISKENHKLSLNIKGNRKPLYKRSNSKLMNKKNLEYYKYRKKGYFKSECRSKFKDQIDYRNF